MDKFPEMLESLYRNEYYRLYMRAVNELGDFFLAEDVVEEVFIAIIRHNRWWSGLNEPEKIKYAEKMCTSICREILNKKERFKFVEYKDDIEARDDVQSRSQVRLIERDALYRSLRGLDDLDKEIFVEKYFDGLTIKSIAGLHHISEAKVAQRLSRGRKKLLKLIK